MAYFVDAAIGAISDVHATQMNPLGARRRDNLGREWIYLKGVASTVVGSWVTYDELFVTTLLAANAKGPVAVAGAITVAGTYGWYCIHTVANSVSAKIAANCAADVLIGRESADGTAGDGRAAGDEIYNCFSREATTSAAVAQVQFAFPFVDDAKGS